MKNTAFFHIAKINNYQSVVQEIFKAFIDSGLIEELEALNLVILGPSAIFLPHRPKINILFEDDDLTLGEAKTLGLLKEYAGSCGSDANILYVHTKGVLSGGLNACIDDWRKLMIYFNIEKWKEATQALIENDTCGVDLRSEPALHYSGNFWWAKSDYIQTLPPLSEVPPIISERHKSEFWITSRQSAKHKALWDCGIDVYYRHLFRYEDYLYKDDLTRKERYDPATSGFRNPAIRWTDGNGIEIGYGDDGQKPIAGDASRLVSFGSNVYDTVFSSHVLEAYEDTGKVIQEWIRVVKKGGKLVLLLTDRKKYERYCSDTNQAPSPDRKIEDFGPPYIKNVLKKIKGVRITHVREKIGEYKFLFVIEKTRETMRGPKNPWFAHLPGRMEARLKRIVLLRKIINRCKRKK